MSGWVRVRFMATGSGALFYGCSLRLVGEVPSWWTGYREGGIVVVKSVQHVFPLAVWADGRELVPWDAGRVCALLADVAEERGGFLEVAPLATLSQLLGGARFSVESVGTLLGVGVKESSCLESVAVFVLENLFRPLLGIEADHVKRAEVVLERTAEGWRLVFSRVAYVLEYSEPKLAVEVEPGPVVEVCGGEVLVRL